jgi:hypothetical protein
VRDERKLESSFRSTANYRVTPSRPATDTASRGEPPVASTQRAAEKFPVDPAPSERPRDCAAAEPSTQRLRGNWACPKGRPKTRPSRRKAQP